jgi:hypothetical protein
MQQRDDADAADTVEMLAAAVLSGGIATVRSALPPSWADELAEDFDLLFSAASERPAGRIPRGRNRYYFSVHPEELRGFATLMTHPQIDGLCASLLGADYQIVEVGFDVPLPGALAQPWHRDFPVPDETRDTGFLSSIAINATCVDVTPEMGPIDVVPGSHRQSGLDLVDGMYVRPDDAARYDAMGEPRLPRRGDVSVRTGLMMHRGTPNRSDRARPTLIVGVIAAPFPTFAEHQLDMTPAARDRLPPALQGHLQRCRIVDRLEPIEQEYVLGGLMTED